MVSRADLEPSEDPRDIPGEELDRLFSLVDRRPFAQEGGLSLDPSQDIGERTDIPQDAIGVGQDIGFPPDVSGIITTGVRNGDWNDLPPDGLATTIDDIDNKLPGWSFTQETGTGGVATIETDAAGAAGRAIKFLFPEDPDENDYMYVEQFIYASSLIRFMSIAADHAGGAKVSLVIETEFFDSTGASADGGSSKDLVTATDAKFSRMWRAPAAPNKQLLRIRIGARVTTDWSSGAQSRNIRHVTAIPPQLHTINMYSFRGNLSASASTVYDIFMGNDNSIVNGEGMLQYLPGFVLGTSTHIVSDITAGTASVYLTNIGNGNVGPSTILTDSTVGATGYQLLDGATAYDFEIGDYLVPKYSTDSDYTDNGVDIIASFLLLLVAHDTNSWTDTYT